MSAKIRAMVREYNQDPHGNNYSTLTPLQIVAAMNNENVTRPTTRVTGDDMFQSANSTELAALTQIELNIWTNFCAKETMDPRPGSNNSALVKRVFGNPSQSLQNFRALRQVATTPMGARGHSGRVRLGEVERMLQIINP